MMNLAKEAISELNAIGLSGASITKVECLTNETRITFLIEGIEVFFTARNITEYAIISINHQGQVFDDPNVLSQYDAWVKYVLTTTYPIIEAKRLKAAEVAYKASVETLQPEEDAIVGSGENVSAERLEDAEARGRKEGFKAARKRNLKEMKALKKKYNMIIAITVIVLIAIFAIIWIFMRPETGVSTPPPPMEQQGTSPGYEAPGSATEEGLNEETEGTDPEQVNGIDNTEENNEGAVAESATALVELGETFKFDHLGITLGTEVTWDEVENELTEYNGEAVFQIPMTVVNTSEVTHRLDVTSFRQFGPDGERLAMLGPFFDNAIGFVDGIEPGTTQEAYMHFLFVGNGEYIVEFQNRNEPSERVKVSMNVERAE